MESFLTLMRDGNEHVMSETFYRAVASMRGGFQLGHWDFKKKKWVRTVKLHWKYHRNDPEWTFRELKLKAYWPVVDPWIRKRLVSDTLTFDEAPASAKHDRPRV
jgi:hypothetical protein